MYDKTIIRFGFCDIQNNQGLSKGYQPQPSASVDNPYLDLDYSGYQKKPHPIIVYRHWNSHDTVQWTPNCSNYSFFNGSSNPYLTDFNCYLRTWGHLSRVKSSPLRVAAAGRSGLRRSLGRCATSCIEARFAHF